MARYIESAPESWGRAFLLSSAGSVPLELQLELPLDGAVRHWGQDFSFHSPLSAAVKAYRSGRFVAVELSICAEATTACSRCLEPAGVAINGKLKYLYSLRGDHEVGPAEGKTSENDGGPEELIEEVSADESVNLGELAWETLVTALPPSSLCSPQCRGLCAECGANLNDGGCDCKKASGDPRFEVLKDLIEE